MRTEIESPDAQIECNGNETEETQARRRLRKALVVAEKFKQKYLVEQQVSSELARRCDELKAQSRRDRTLICEMEIEILRLRGEHSRDGSGSEEMINITRGISNATIASSAESGEQSPTPSANVTVSSSLPTDSVSGSDGYSCASSPLRCPGDDDMDDAMHEITMPPPRPKHHAGVPVSVHTVKYPLPDTSKKESGIKLFEQFLVVGASPEVSNRIKWN